MEMPSSKFFQLSLNFPWKLSAGVLNPVYSAEIVKLMRIHAFWMKESCLLKNSHTNHFLKSLPILPHLRNFPASYHGNRPAAPLFQVVKQLTKLGHVQCSSKRAGLCFGPSTLGQYSVCSALSFPLDFQGRTYSGDSHFFHCSSIHGKHREPDARVSMWFSICVQGIFFCSITAGRTEEWGRISILGLHLSRDRIILHKI